MKKKLYTFRCLLSWYICRNFYVVVVPLKRTPGTVKNLKNPDEMDIEEVRSLKDIRFLKM